MVVLPFVGVAALLLTVQADDGVALHVVCYAVAAVSFAACFFGDQNRLVFLGRRWSMQGEPKLSEAGYAAARAGWLVLATLVAILGAVDVSSLR